MGAKTKVFIFLVSVQPGTLTLAPTVNLESPNNLTCMFLDSGRKPEYPERTHTYTGGTCKLHTERLQLGIEPGTLLLWNHSSFYLQSSFPTFLSNLFSFVPLKGTFNNLLDADQQNLPLNAITSKAKVRISITIGSSTSNVNMKGKREASEDEMRFTAY